MLNKRCLSDLFLDQVKNQPNQISVVRNDKSLTYLELSEKSKNLAIYLDHIGVPSGNNIGVYLESSIELIVSIWGIVLSGNAYLPLAPEYPDHRLQYMINDSKTNYIITQASIVSQLKAIVNERVEIITLEEASNFIDKEKLHSANWSGKTTPKNLAYIIYTSGSTGDPKGVMIEQSSIVNQMNWLKSTYSIDQKTTILQKTPISFDAAQWEILANACGSKLVIGGKGVYRDPERMIKQINQYHITALQCVPTLLQALLQFEEFSTCKSLTQLFSGGEALSKKTAVLFFETFSSCDLINLYGPTECTINASSYKVNRATLDEINNVIPIGFPVENTTFHILDENLVQVKSTEPGELYIGGAQLAKGYINKPKITSEKFIDNPLENNGPKLYKTGDQVYKNKDGSFQFTGRKDNQIKLRGYRIELDEIRIAIENHNWIKNASVLVKENPRTLSNNLITFVELNSKEAALMDQGNHDSHHQSKKNKLQIKAQLSNHGCRSIEEQELNSIIDLPFKQAKQQQHKFSFARKTYRFYKGGIPSKSDIFNLLNPKEKTSKTRDLKTLSFQELGEFLRYFGQFKSEQRLLPKYSYASPGALYATQLYLELNNMCGLDNGFYYYHPVNHQLSLIQKATVKNEHHQMKLHFIGKKSAIKPVYKNNILEVLEIEVGHMLGVFEEVLPNYGLFIDQGSFIPETKSTLKTLKDDYYLGTFEVIPFSNSQYEEEVDIYVQSHNNIIDLPLGTYIYKSNKLEKLSDDFIQKKDVIAINQEVYQRSSIGISIISRTKEEWKKFIVLGKKLQHLQMNKFQFGFMSSGYSSKSNNNLPSANRIQKILKEYGRHTGESYFCVGGLVSDQQLDSQGMDEDIVHMKGPAEMLRDDLTDRLPHYMIPNNIIILDNLPLTPNGKIDNNAIEQICDEYLSNNKKEIIYPKTKTERKIAEIWTKLMKQEKLSVQDDFFELGGNSLIAVALLNKINERFNCKLPMQVLFQYPTIEKLANKVSDEIVNLKSRLVPLQNKGNKNPIFCWPGLGGYAMNLKSLADKTENDQPFYGIQALGINEGEVPYKTITEMAKRDIEEIIAKQPDGPYSLWGFSFGARVAFEACYQLEQQGKVVEDLILIAPGSPKVWSENETANCHNPVFTNEVFVTILFSVFVGSINDSRLHKCLKESKDQDTFTSFICNEFSHLTRDIVTRIIEIVKLTYEFKYNFAELKKRKIKTPISILKAQGDDYSFLENAEGFSLIPPNIIQLQGDHYNILKEPYINDLIYQIRNRKPSLTNLEVLKIPSLSA